MGAIMIACRCIGAYVNKFKSKGGEELVHFFFIIVKGSRRRAPYSHSERNFRVMIFQFLRKVLGMVLVRLSIFSKENKTIIPVISFGRMHTSPCAHRKITAGTPSARKELHARTSRASKWTLAV
jgi:hypothetical protein